MATEKDFQTLKAKFDAYGVGVRAGVITPQPQDEEDFRMISNLPDMSGQVREGWREEGGTRRPITLVAKGLEDEALEKSTSEDGQEEEESQSSAPDEVG